MRPFREVNPPLQAVIELLRLHVVDIAAKAGIAPSAIRAVWARKPPSQGMCLKWIFLRCRAGDSWSRLNCGLCRERGIVRGSTTCWT